MDTKFRSGFVAIIGKPNVGKSTILNSLVSRKIAIVSDKPETTRENIHGIFNIEDAQVVFIDTPGIHKPHFLLGKEMVKKAKSSLYEADILLFVVDLTSGLREPDLLILDLIKEARKPAIAVINKIDKTSKAEILPLIDALKGHYDFTEFIPISAANGDNMVLLKEKVLNSLPQGHRYYTDDRVTDKSEKFQAQEIIREKALLFTRDELPHSIAVGIEAIKDTDTIKRIDAVIYVERDSQKGIIIGHNGSMIKKISTLSRLELEELFKKKIFLCLWVKVLKNWRKDPRCLKLLEAS
jgi:GTP-binding protein Era